uniref:Transposase n=1 Tax=Steinernema glaseri TaxID=37863 RepID=A0A1I7ZAA2_9BILA
MSDVAKCKKEADQSKRGKDDADKPKRLVTISYKRRKSRVTAHTSRKTEKDTRKKTVGVLYSSYQDNSYRD